MGFIDLFRLDKDAIYDKGIDAFKRGDIAAAIKYFTKVVKLDASDAPAHYNLALSYVAIKHYGTAVSHFRQYMRLDPIRVNKDLREYVDILDRAASVDTTKADEILRDYVRKQGQASSQVTVFGSFTLLKDLNR
jgi:tetratricopeptide (TPR) repeat protein